MPKTHPVLTVAVVLMVSVTVRAIERPVIMAVLSDIGVHIVCTIVVRTVLHVTNPMDTAKRVLMGFMDRIAATRVPLIV